MMCCIKDADKWRWSDDALSHGVLRVLFRQGLTLLMKAVSQGNEEAVLCLINNAAFVNAKVRIT